MEKLWRLGDPNYVARFQRFCGVELVKPDTCDQETQTVKPEVCGKQTRTKRKNSSEEKENSLISNGSSKLTPNLKKTQQQNGQSIASNGEVRNVLTQRNQNSDKVKECNNNNSNKPNESNTFCAAAYCNGSSISCQDNHHCQQTNNTNNCSNNKSVTGKNGLTTCPSCTCSNNGETLFNNETKKTTPAYTIKYKSLLYLAHFGAFLGNEEFYLTFFPFCVWNLDSLIVRQISLLWCFVMYLGQAGKDYLCWPRPPFPPVVRLEFSYLQEFSMPSTHAMAGTAIPLYMAYLVVDRYQVPVPIAAALALFWFVTTCYSRLYLGVHSILDLLAGIVFSLFLYVTFITYIQDYDLYQQTHRFAPVMVLSTALALSTFCYPSKHRISSKGDAVQIVSSVAGFSIGFWLLYQLDYTHMPTESKPYTIVLPTLHWILIATLRFLSGSAVLGIFYLIMKPSSIRFFSYLYGLDKPDKTNSSVVTGYKFVTYFSLGILISLFIPLMHVWLGIPRMSFFNEVI